MSKLQVMPFQGISLTGAFRITRYHFFRKVGFPLSGRPDSGRFGRLLSRFRSFENRFGGWRRFPIGPETTCIPTRCRRRRSPQDAGMTDDCRVHIGTAIPVLRRRGDEPVKGGRFVNRPYRRRRRGDEAMENAAIDAKKVHPRSRGDESRAWPAPTFVRNDSSRNGQNVYKQPNISLGFFLSSV